MHAMMISPADSNLLKALLKNALTNKTDDLEMFLRGIDYSYYYEEIKRRRNLREYQFIKLKNSCLSLL